MKNKYHLNLGSQHLFISLKIFFFFFQKKKKKKKKAIKNVFIPYMRYSILCNNCMQYIAHTTRIKIL